MNQRISLESLVREALRVTAFDDDDTIAADIAKKLTNAGYVNPHNVERWRRTIIVDMTDNEHERVPMNAPTHCIEAWLPGRVVNDTIALMPADVSTT